MLSCSLPISYLARCAQTVNSLDSKVTKRLESTQKRVGDGKREIRRGEIGMVASYIDSM